MRGQGGVDAGIARFFICYQKTLQIACIVKALPLYIEIYISNKMWYDEQ